MNARARKLRAGVVESNKVNADDPGAEHPPTNGGGGPRQGLCFQRTDHHAEQSKVPTHGCNQERAVGAPLGKAEKRRR